MNGTIGFDRPRLLSPELFTPELPRGVVCPNCGRRYNEACDRCPHCGHNPDRNDADEDSDDDRFYY